MPDEYYIDEDELAKFWNSNRSRMNGVFPLKDFLAWSREWVAACAELKRIAKQLEGE